MASHVWIKATVLIMASQFYLPLSPDFLPHILLSGFTGLQAIPGTWARLLCQDLCTHSSLWSRSLFLCSAQLMCLFFQTFTFRPFRETFSDWLVHSWLNWNLCVKEKMVPTWSHGSVVDRWTSRWFAGLPIWRYLGHIIIYVIVISRALCLEPVLYKEKGPFF